MNKTMKRAREDVEAAEAELRYYSAQGASDSAMRRLVARLATAKAKLDLADQALTFIRMHGPVRTRDLFESGPAPTLHAAQAVVRSLQKRGVIYRAETARGGFAGWVAP